MSIIGQAKKFVRNVGWENARCRRQCVVSHIPLFLRFLMEIFLITCPPSKTKSWPLELWNLHINQILSHGITPIFVFDGKPFPAKLSTNSDRAKQRLAAYAEANAYLNNNNRAKVEECAKKAIAITSVMIFSVVHNVLRPRGISYLVAPYEADGQIVALCLQHPDYAVDSIDGICFRGFSFV